MLSDTSTPSRRARFAEWRRTRPFWGGVLTTASGAFLLLPAFTTVKIGNLLVSISTIGGVSTLLLGALMVVCAATVLVGAGARVPAGVGAMIIALVALPAANFGGFVVGTVLGVFGAAAILAWAPHREAEPVNESSF